MRVKISPCKVSGKVHIPPSKSMAHRAIICAALADGKSVIKNIAYSEDIKATIQGMKQLGASIECHHDFVVVEGITSFNDLKDTEIFCNESGSTLRFFIPIFSLCDKKISFTGKNRLLKRPQRIYEEIFTNQNISYTQTEKAITIGGTLHSGEYTIRGDVSSQFISGLLFTLPLLEHDSLIHIVEPYESRSYVDLTLQMLAHFGIQAYYQNSNTISIPGKQHYIANDYTIEGDYSQFAFFAVLAAINHDLDCLSLSHDSLQGDKQILSILENAGVPIETIENGYRIHQAPLKASEINLENCPDLGPILNVLAMYAPQTTRIFNAQRLRYKESDRIAAMEEELNKCNVEIKTTESEILITGNSHYQSKEVILAHNDHRIVMSMCVAATLFDAPIIIEGAQAINKSYPTFFEDFLSIGGKVEFLDD